MNSRATALFALVIACSLVAGVLGHAKLNVPTAWNPQPSTSNPCGGGAAATVAAATWESGSTAPLTWQVVAGDGTGPLTMKIDRAGGTNFGTTATTLTFTGPTPTTTTTYNYQVNVPAGLTCTGTNGLCTLQVRSSSNWVACSSIRIQASTPPPPPAPTVACATATGLSFCTGVNGKNVQLPVTGASLASVDAIVQQTVAANQFNSMVFDNGGNALCTSAYTDFLCALMFPLCTTTAVPPACQSRCVSTLNQCGVNATHQFLYDCTTMVATGSDAQGTCPANVPSVVLLSPAFAALDGTSIITITGFNMGSGTDVTSVALAGIPATIQTQSATEIVVRAGVAARNAMGSVVTISTSKGRAVSVMPFVYAGAPLVESAYIVGSQVTVTFDIPTNMGGYFGNFSCDSVLNIASTVNLGTGSSCYWYDTRTLIMMLGAGATLSSSTSLALQPNTIMSVGTNQIATGTFVVSTPPAGMGWVAAPILIGLAIIAGVIIGVYVYRRKMAQSGGSLPVAATATPAKPADREVAAPARIPSTTQISGGMPDTPAKAPKLGSAKPVYV